MHTHTLFILGLDLQRDEWNWGPCFVNRPNLPACAVVRFRRVRLVVLVGTTATRAFFLTSREKNRVLKKHSNLRSPPLLLHVTPWCYILHSDADSTTRYLPVTARHGIEFISLVLMTQIFRLAPGCILPPLPKGDRPT